MVENIFVMFVCIFLFILIGKNLRISASMPLAWAFALSVRIQPALLYLRAQHWTG